MKLNSEQIKSITQGALDVIEDADGIRFFRFNREEMDFYKPLDTYPKVFATAGVQLEFKTDAKEMKLAVDMSTASTRSFFSFDVYVNGEFFDEMKNFPDDLEPTGYSQMKFELGLHEKRFELGAGTKTVRVVFPFSVFCAVKELELEGATNVVPVKLPKILLAYGDSITHGYDALHFFRSYIAKLARHLDAELYNKGIGGEIFRPGLAAIKNNIDPDYITVAYGSNDFNHALKSELEGDCENFLKNLKANYPRAEIFAISPIWRADCGSSRNGEFESFSEISDTIKACAERVGVHYIYGFDFVPHDKAYFGDLPVVHPNEKGFEMYFNALKAEIDKVNGGNHIKIAEEIITLADVDE